MTKFSVTLSRAAIEEILSDFFGAKDRHVEFEWRCGECGPYEVVLDIEGLPPRSANQAPTPHPSE